MFKSYFLIPLFFLAGSLEALAQGSGNSFSLEEAMQYAVKEHNQVKLAAMDVKSSDAQIGEIRATGLPQVSMSASYTRNLRVQSQFLPGDAFDFGDQLGFVVQPLIADGTIDPTTIPEASGDEIQGLAFGVDHMTDAHLEASQLLFSGSYIVGLKAAKTYKELTKKQKNQTERDVAFNVAKAYYGALIAQERMGMLKANIRRLDSLLDQTQKLNKEGFAENIDVMRLSVQLNNLKSEKSKVQQLVTLSNKLLNYQMGRGVNEPITLTDSLGDQMLTQVGKANPEANAENRLEYSILETQQELARLDIQNNKANALPTLAAFGRLGNNYGANNFGDVWLVGDWPSYSLIGVNFSWNLFTGLQRTYKLQQAKVAYEKTEIGFEELRRGIELEALQASTNLDNALEDLEVQKENMKLAEEVSRVANIKYKEGVGTNLEVVNAESDYQEARTNYYNALYDVMINHLELQKAKGEFSYPTAN